MGHPQPELKRPQEFWDRYHMDMAARTAALSKDPDRKVGAVLLSADRRQMSFGYNGFPPDFPDREDLLADKALKNDLMVHAEENCLHQAPFNPVGCSLAVTRFPCCNCAELIIRARVARVLAPRPDFGHLRWGDSWIRALEKLQEAHVHVTFMEVLEK